MTPPIETKPPIPADRWAQLTVVGWLGDKVVVVAQVAGLEPTQMLVSLDPADGLWEPLGPTFSGLGPVASDGSSVLARVGAGVEGGDRLVRMTPAGDTAAIPFDDAALWRDWVGWGDIEVMPSGGYLLTQTAALVRVSTDGVLATRPVPDGWIVQAPTPDPDVFVLGTQRPDDNAEARTITMTGLARWEVGSEDVGEVIEADAVGPSSVSLAFVHVAGEGWFALNEDGLGARVADDMATTVNPDGGRFAVAPVNDDLCPDPPSVGPECAVRVVDGLSGSVVDTWEGPATSEIFWHGSSAAYTVRTDGDPAIVVGTDGASALYRPPPPPS